ncbi:MAG: CheR family methyltransferase [Spartobacteria bacterium]
MAPQILTDADYEHISRIIYQHSRIHLGDGKRELVSSRLGKRLRATGCETYSAYCALLSRPEGEAEINQLVDAISTNHTFFFREKKHFSFLEETVLREFHHNAAYRGDGCFRCWSAAASTGEEPYSIAITLARHEDLRPGFRWEIDCSEISSTALDTARQGIYTNDRINELPQDVRRRFFQRGIGRQEGRSRVKQILRDRMAWHLMNLFHEPYPFEKKFHLIFCRNVMIYFDRPSQEWLVQKMSRLLVPGGYLKVGHSKSLSTLQHGLQPIQPAVYRKPSN